MPRDGNHEVSIWVYAYSEGIGSAREVERLMQYEPGLQWLCGLQGTNHHSLSDFRVDHRAALDELFTQLLGLLESEGLLSLEQVMHDGTKIRALAGADSMRREKTVREHLERARQLVEAMGDPRDDQNRREAARRRSARERKEKLEHALEQLRQMEAERDKRDDEAEPRVSESEPEVRLMKHGDNAIVPSYNVQISTEAANKLIVGVHLSQCSSDAGSLVPAVDTIHSNLGKDPAQVVVDGGFTNCATIGAMAEREIDMIGSLTDPAVLTARSMKANGIDPAYAPQCFVILDAEHKTLRCPAGKTLAYVGTSTKHGNQYLQYRARGGDCSVCESRQLCCPKSAHKGRTVSVLDKEDPHVAALRRKMQNESARQIYKRRAEVAEFPNAWIKAKFGLRKFHLRGLVKAGLEAVWACLTYNVMQWIRLAWQKPELCAGA
jgi:hypothetical protein